MYRLIVTRILTILRATEITPANCGPVYAALLETARGLAAEMRRPCPRLFVIPEYAPNAMMLDRNCLVLSESVTSVLTQGELEILLRICLIRMQARSLRLTVLVAYFFHPIVRCTRIFPRVWQWCLYPVWASILRLWFRPQGVLKADKIAIQKNTRDVHLFNSLLLKMTTSAKYIPIRADFWTFDGLFFLSPLQAKYGALQYFPTHPDLKERLEQLHSCEMYRTLS